MASILTVDDSLSARQVLYFTLRADGHEITAAADGLEALAIARLRDFDLVIADINMPRLGGLGLISELRRLPGFETTPLLVLSSESGADKKLAGRLAGASGWMVKPFNPKELRDLVRRILS